PLRAVRTRKDTGAATTRAGLAPRRRSDPEGGRAAASHPRPLSPAPASAQPAPELLGSCRASPAAGAPLVKTTAGALIQFRPALDLPNQRPAWGVIAMSRLEYRLQGPKVGGLVDEGVIRPGGGARRASRHVRRARGGQRRGAARERESAAPEGVRGGLGQLRVGADRVRARH